jgi:small subunit ribosomal protein S9
MKAASLPGRLVRSSQVCSSANVFRAFPRQRHGLQASVRHSSTISDPPVAAPQIDFAQMSRNNSKNLHARVVPASPSYFTGLPQFMDSLLKLQALLRKNETLPVVKPGQAPRVAWQTLESYRSSLGEHVRTSKYQKVIQILHRLNHIHPTLKTPEVIAAIEAHRRTIDPFANIARPITIDRFGRALGVGRRKSSTARAWLVEGNGEILVNGKTLVEAFSRVHDRESAIWALKATERIDKYNVWALVEGGGTTGQAEALTLGVTKALLAHEPLLKPALRRGKRNLPGNILLIVRLFTNSLSQLVVSRAIRERWRGRRPATSRLGRCLRGSRDSCGAVAMYCIISVHSRNIEFTIST